MSIPLSSNYRPRIVTTIGRLRLLAGILGIGFGLYLVSSPTGYLRYMGESESEYVSQEELDYYSDFVGIFIATLGVIGVVIAFGILYGKRRAWTANVAYSSILIVLSAADVVFGYPRSVMAIIFNGFILGYMFAGPVKAYFGRVSLPPAPVTASTAAA
ncbi:MAG: hypothetical protein ACREBU_19235 [Nitrososphaera sp.]